MNNTTDNKLYLKNMIAKLSNKIEELLDSSNGFDDNVMTDVLITNDKVLECKKNIDNNIKSLISEINSNKVNNISSEENYNMVYNQLLKLTMIINDYNKIPEAKEFEYLSFEGISPSFIDDNFITFLSNCNPDTTEE